MMCPVDNKGGLWLEPSGCFQHLGGSLFNIADPSGLLRNFMQRFAVNFGIRREQHDLELPASFCRAICETEAG